MKRSRYIGGFFLALFLWGYEPNCAWSEEPARYIVRFKAPSPSTVTAKSFSNGSIATMATMANAERVLPLDNSVVVTLNSSERDRLAMLPDVESIEVDKKIKAFLVPNDPLYSDQYALKGTHGIRAPQAWNTTRGSTSKLVAVIDTGIDFTHEDLQDNIWSNPGEIASNGVDDDSNGYIDDISGYDFGSDEGDSDPSDENGHGTHVSGIIAATGNNGIGVTGVAWNTALIPVKCLDDQGSGFISYLVNSLDYVSTLKDQGYPIAVVNMSLGTDEYSEALTRAVQRAASRGIVLVAAAGNSYGQNNDGIPSYPANTESPNVISVAATNAAGELANFSNFGPKTVDLAAPGSDILSTYPTIIKASGYGYLDGTSMAAPAVAGVAALVASANPAAKPTLIRDIILSTVKPLRSVKDKVVSDGLVDAYSAVRVAVASVKRYTVSGTVKRRTQGVAKVNIALSLSTGPRYRKTAVTSSTGRFVFRNVPAGTYTLRAARSGITFTTSSQRVVVTASKTVTFTAR